MSDPKKVFLIILIALLAYISYYQNSSVIFNQNTIDTTDDNLVINKTSKPFLGVRVYLITDDLAKMQLLPTGAYVQEVIIESPAEKADIKVGDVILQVNETRINGQNTLSKVILRQKIGETVEILLYRDEVELLVNVILQGSEELIE